MLIQDLKHKYKNIPFTTLSLDYRKNNAVFVFEQLTHMHKEIELLVVIEGNAKVFVENTSFDIKQGDIVMIPPFTLHHYETIIDYDFKHFCLCFDCEILYDKTFGTDLENGNITFKSFVEQNKECAELIEKTFFIHLERDPGWEFKVIGNVSSLFGIFTELQYFEKEHIKTTDKIFSKIFDYVNNNYNKDISSSDIANYLHVSRSYFCRLFKKYFGDTFQNYLCKCRIEKSKSLLKHTNMSIAEIATDVGFNSLSYYSKKFKEYLLLTPNEYRNNGIG